MGDCVGAYDFDAAWADYRRASFAGFIMAVISAMIVERTERGDEMFATMAERSGWQALHLDALALSGPCPALGICAMTIFNTPILSRFAKSSLGVYC